MTGWFFAIAFRPSTSHPEGGDTVCLFATSVSSGEHYTSPSGNIATESVAIIVIELGANDGLRGQSVSRMREHLHEMITRCKVYGEVLLLGIRLPPNYGKKYTEAFDQSFAQIAKKNNIPFVPFILDGIALHEQYMQLDGLHPTAEAQAVILENIWPTLNTILDSLITNH